MENFLYFIGGIIITTIVGVIVAKWQMKKNKIIHFSINSYDVGKGLHNEFPKFQLTYENKELNNEVQVLKGGFVNIGRSDIIGLKNNSDINMILPKSCSLKDIKIKPLSDDLGVKACVNEKTPNIINFAINEKFMSGEGFEYTAIIETTEEIRNLHRKIDFKHRIPNTSKITNEYIGQQTRKGVVRGTGEKLPELKSLVFFSIVAALFFCIASAFLFFAQKVQYSVIEKGTEKEFALYMTPKSQFYISDSNWIPFLDKTDLSKEELDRNYYVSLQNKYLWSSSDSILGFVLTFFALIYIISTFLSVFLWNRKKHIYHLLEQYEQE